MFSNPLRATWTILASITVSNSHNGGMQPCRIHKDVMKCWATRTISNQQLTRVTRNRICSGVPPDVALVMAQAASLRVLNSALPKISIRTGKILASITACPIKVAQEQIIKRSAPKQSIFTDITWICCLFPAVMLEIVQQASLRIDSLGELSKWSRQCMTEQLSTTCVCTSSPVTMLPTARSAPCTTDGVVCINNSTNRRQTPASMTAWILSLGPSERYDKAQQASAKTSASEWNNNRASTGRHGDTWTAKEFLKTFFYRNERCQYTLAKLGGGFFPRHKLDKAQTPFRIIDNRLDLLNNLCERWCVK